MNVLQIFGYIIYSCLSIFDLLMLVRAICSWVYYFRESKIYAFAFMITEPVLKPVRDLFMRSESIRRFPIDLSFLFVYIVLTIAMNLIGYYIF